MADRFKGRNNKISTIYDEERGTVSSKSQNGGVSASYENNDYCIIGRYFAYILMLTSIFGMAPLRFKSHEKGFRISVSKPMCIFSYVLGFLLGLATIFVNVVQVSLILDTTKERSAKLKHFFFLYCYMTLTMSTIASVIRGPRRMKNLIMHLNNIVKVDTCLGTQYSRLKDYKMFITVISMFVLFTALSVHHCYKNRVFTNWDESFSLYLLNLVRYFMMNMYIQLVYIFVTLRTRFQSINDALTVVTCQWSAELKSYLPASVNVCVIQEDETATDKVVIVRKSVAEYPRLVEPPDVAVQRIAILRGSLCDIVNRINSECGFLINISMLSTFGNVVIALFFLISMISKPEQLKMAYFDVMIHCLYLASYSAAMIFIIEPCHNTIQEDKKTRRILCHMMRSAPPSGMLLSLLEMFGYQVMLKPASYEPLGMCTLNRPLMVSIIGAVSTYLVILLKI